MREELEVLISEEEIKQRVEEIAEQINKDYEGKKVHLICILKGSVFFMCELAKHITVPVTMDFMSVSSYGDGMTSSGHITITNDLGMDIKGRDCIVVEDIIDSGRTLSYLKHLLKKRNPNSLAVCTMLDKPSRRVVDVDVEYKAFDIEDKFVIGFGLDYAQKYRNLPYIGELQIKEE